MKIHSWQFSYAIPPLINETSRRIHRTFEEKINHEHGIKFQQNIIPPSIICKINDIKGRQPLVQ